MTQSKASAPTVQNKHLSITLQDDSLLVAPKNAAKSFLLAWPGVCLSLGGRKIAPKRPASAPRKKGQSVSQVFLAGDLEFTVTVQLSKGPWFTKSVSIRSERELPTPDYVEVDRQILDDDGLEVCGYKPATSVNTTAGQKEEEGQSKIPGCGYPLIGRSIFAGLEHPAGFNHVQNSRSKGKQTIWMRHYPTWEGKSLQQVDAVFGIAPDARQAFADYLDSIRLPVLTKPLICFCTFWSDPYLGNNEYLVTQDTLSKFVKGFDALDVIPDYFTLDAGWNDRNSVFQAKEGIGLDAGLRKLNKLMNRLGSKLSLWLSHNGPMGINPDYMRKSGFEVGKGNGAAYPWGEYGVMMDKSFSNALKDRFCELTRQVGATHYKIDWDNECATNPSFSERYPTVDHVRQASLDEFFSIARALREANSDVVIRNAWWPSPWWLMHSNHIWLCESGDCEYSSIPSKSQRDSASTHRDTMYFNILQRDKTPVPLDCFDNHEFADAPRNPFVETPAEWVNALWLSVMRGSTYIAYTLQPESLESWQAESLRNIMNFTRAYADRIFVPNGKMILGNPNKGDVYGFLQPGEEESWCILRNPLPVPQTIEFNAAQYHCGNIKTIWQFYPHCETFACDAQITLLPHEVKVIILSSKAINPVFDAPYMIKRKDNGYEYSFAGTTQTSPATGPIAHPDQLVRELKCSDSKQTLLADGQEFCWFLNVPSRTRNTELVIHLKGKNATSVRPKVWISRYNDKGSRSCLPITSITAGEPGYGEMRNRVDVPVKDDAFFTVSIPDGGQFGLWLELHGTGNRKLGVEAWVTGYQAPTRTGIMRKTCPAPVKRCLPCQHPLGFGQAIRLPITQ